MNFIRIFFLLFLSIALVQCATDTEKKGAAAQKPSKLAKAQKSAKAKNTKAGTKAVNNAKRGVAKKLNFTPQQQKKFAAINQKYFKKDADFRKANKGKLNAIKKNKAAITAARDKEMKAFMKPEQYTKYKQMTQRKGAVKKPTNK